MVAAIDHKCIRLIRISIEALELGNMQPGEVVEIKEADFFRKLKL
jgi:23S rRNA pseudouridine2457 synthase